MTHVSRLPRWSAGLLLLACLSFAAPGTGFAAAPVIGSAVVGSPNTAIADPTVPRPHTTPCTAQLFSNQTFADFSPKAFTYTPPAACPGPWSKVVLEADFSVTAGRQFDRTAEIAIGHVNVYYGTTAEPSATVSPSWHVERDLTDYSPLFRTAQSGDVNLGNLVNPTYTGIITGSAVLKFYPPSFFEPALRTADVVLPLSSDPGGASNLATTSSVLAPTFSLPANIEGAYLDVITQSQSGDEFWYTCVPDDVADELFSCPGTAFREAEISIDGQPAGIAPVYPWLYTGGIDPYLWRPIPGVQALNFLPYRVDLTPFAGVLSNGHPHQVGLSVYNANNYFAVTGSLLLYLDRHATQVTGAVTKNTIGSVPPPVLQENLSTAPDGTITGTVTTGSARSFTLAGYVNTSHGRVETTVKQELHFSNDQQFLVAAAQYVQNITQKTTVSATTETKQGIFVVRSEKQLSYPFSVDINFLSNADGSSSQATTMDQWFLSQETLKLNGIPFFFSRVSNAVTPSDTLLFSPSGALTGRENQRSTQTYFAESTDGRCYSRTISAENGLLTSLVDGAGCHGHD